MPEKRAFSPQELDELDLPYNCIASWLVEEKRWSLVKNGVFEHDGQHWMIEFEDGATEMQECDLWGDRDEIVAIAVEKREVTVERWMPKEENDES